MKLSTKLAVEFLEIVAAVFILVEWDSFFGCCGLSGYLIVRFAFRTFAAGYLVKNMVRSAQSVSVIDSRTMPDIG